MAAAIDPGALYNENLADLNAQIGNKEAALGEREGFEQTNTANAENLLGQQEPLTYTAESNRANKGGLLNSGINTQRKGTIAASYASKRTANQAKLAQEKAENQRTRQGYGIEKTMGEHTAARTRAANEEAYNANNPKAVPPYAPAGTPQIPAGMPPPPGMEFVNGLTVPIGTRTVKAKARG